jgi:hypothetical protein
MARLGPLFGAGSFFLEIYNGELIQKQLNWVMYTGMPYWNHLGTKLHKNDANSRCDHVDFVL